MAITIRSLLDCLEEWDPNSIRRLCRERNVGGRSGDARCEALARKYRGIYQAFLGDLRKSDLVELLTKPTEIDGTDYYLPAARSYPPDDLRQIAQDLFENEEIDGALEAVDEEDDEEDEVDEWDEDEEYDEDDEDEDQDDDVDEWEEDEDLDDIEACFREDSKPQEIRLHPYQEVAVDSLLEALPGAIFPQLLHIGTGGGKTVIANALIACWLREQGGCVLWITKDWRLLYQAAAGALRQTPGLRLGRIGGSGSALRVLDEDEEAQIQYTTIQTLLNRLEEGTLRRLRPSLLVWDECHWGVSGRSRKILKRCEGLRIPVLGLTATPRKGTPYVSPFGCTKTFKELVDEGYLARPLIEKPVQTDVDWSPRRALSRDGSEYGDVTRGSLVELANKRKRNELIVKHYREFADKYGKTIVFTCSVKHANILAKMFGSGLGGGAAARPMHSHQSDVKNRQALKLFKDDNIQILTNMEMLTHWIDVPDAQTVFLCRPTASDILFSQMVGRASRVHKESGKRTFNIVEFTDNVDQHGDIFTTAKTFFKGAGFEETEAGGDGGRGAAVLAVRSERRLLKHEFDENGASTWTSDDSRLPEDIRSLWYREGQTFGIEFELTDPRLNTPKVDRQWKDNAEYLRASIAAVLPGRVAPEVICGYAGQGGDKDTSLWNVEFDASAGWEVTTPVLCGEEGFLEVSKACLALKRASERLGLTVNHRTGTHIHLGWRSKNVPELLRAIRFARLFEPGLATIVPASRVFEFDGKTYDLELPNEYCRPVASVFPAKRLRRLTSRGEVLEVAEQDDARYVTFNVKPLETIHTVEVRMHGGTLEAGKILTWISLWQQILWAAANHEDVPEVSDVEVIQPKGDIVALAQRWLPNAYDSRQRRFLEKLDRRRREIHAGLPTDVRHVWWAPSA